MGFTKQLFLSSAFILGLAVAMPAPAQGLDGAGATGGIQLPANPGGGLADIVDGSSAVVSSRAGRIVNSNKINAVTTQGLRIQELNSKVAATLEDRDLEQTNLYNDGMVVLATPAGGPLNAGSAQQLDQALDQVVNMGTLVEPMIAEKQAGGGFSVAAAPANPPQIDDNQQIPGLEGALGGVNCILIEGCSGVPTDNTIIPPVTPPSGGPNIPASLLSQLEGQIIEREEEFSADDQNSNAEPLDVGSATEKNRVNNPNRFFGSEFSAGLNTVDAARLVEALIEPVGNQ